MMVAEQQPLFIVDAMPADAIPVAPMAVDAMPADAPPIEARPVEVIRSKRRTKTAEARIVDGGLRIRIPARMSKREEREMVEHFVAKFAKKRTASDAELAERATELARRFGLPKPLSIRWVTNQQFRWGSCTPTEGTIRLSHRLLEYPTWVADYVIVHELAHFVETNHSETFWELVNRYPLTERARGFLIAKGADGE